MLGKLRDITVLNTLSVNSGKQLADKIEANGGISINCPMLRIIPIEGFERKLPSTCDLIIFQSPNAVRFGLKNIVKHFKHLPEIAAIGPKTREILQHSNLSVSYCPTNLVSSEGLLELLPNKKFNSVLLCKGIGGRTILKDYFLNEGVNVTQANVYQRENIKTIPHEISMKLNHHEVDIILGTSEASIKNFMRLIPSHMMPNIKDIPWLVLSPRLANILKDFKFEKIHLVPDGNIFSALIHWHQSN